jgi:hypothetical protein
MATEVLLEAGAIKECNRGSMRYPKSDKIALSACGTAICDDGMTNIQARVSEGNYAPKAKIRSRSMQRMVNQLSRLQHPPICDKARRPTPVVAAPR